MLASLLAILSLVQGSGTIEGRVIDRLGRPVPFAYVRVDRAGGAGAQATADTAGEWRIAIAEPGLYRLTVRQLGYQTLQQDLQVEPDQLTRVTIVLQPAPLTLDTVVVYEPSDVVRAGELGTKLARTQIAMLPTTLDPRRLISLTPGARPDQIWGGASDQANSYVFDGTSVTHIGVGGAVLLPNPNWIQTLEVRGLGAGADVAGVQGGLVEVVTLEGRNVMEGGLRTSFESHRLNASNLVPQEIGRELAQRWDVDGQLRGPLIPDRLHFALFGHSTRQEELVPNYLPSRTGQFVVPRPMLSDYHGLVKLSWKVTDHDLIRANLTARYQRGERTEQTGYEETAATTRLQDWNAAGNVTWERNWAADNWLTVRGGGYAAVQRQDPYSGPDVPGIEILRQSNSPLYQNAPWQTRGAPSNYSLAATWSRPARLMGLSHEVRLGVQYTLGTWDFQQQRTAAMTWRPLDVVGFDPQTPATWGYGGAIPTAWGGAVHLNSRVHDAAVFLQDRISLFQRFEFSPGIRLGRWLGALKPSLASWTTVVRDRAVDLRIGASGELDRKAGFVAKAHWGRYHQPMFGGLFDRVAGMGVYSDEEIWSYLGSAPARPTDAFTVAQRDSLAASGLFRLDQINRLADAGRVEGYHEPFVDQSVASVERNIGARWKAGAVLVLRRNRDMVALVDRNLASNYTVVDNVIVRDRFHRPVLFEGAPLVLDHLAISNDDILYVQDLARRGLLLGNQQLLAPPGLDAAALAALQYTPDLVLTSVPQATRRFKQLQLRLDARYPSWWGGGSIAISSLDGNLNIVTGPDDYTNGGPGPWVRLNEQYGFFGALSNQSLLEGKAYVGAQFPGRVRAGALFSYASGDHVAPTMLISPLLTEYALPVPRPSDPTVIDTLPFTSLLLRSISGHRIFLRPRGSYRYESRSSLDLHVDRGFARGSSEFIVTLDAFNVLGDRSITATEVVVNTVGGFFTSDYGRVRARVPPRSLQLGAAIQF